MYEKCEERTKTAVMDVILRKNLEIESLQNQLRNAIGLSHSEHKAVMQATIDEKDEQIQNLEAEVGSQLALMRSVKVCLAVIVAA